MSARVGFGLSSLLSISLSSAVSKSAKLSLDNPFDNVMERVAPESFTDSFSTVFDPSKEISGSLSSVGVFGVSGNRRLGWIGSDNTQELETMRKIPIIQ